MANWNQGKARKFLNEQLDRRAEVAGLSDRALARLSALSDPAAPSDRRSFVHALEKAGWSERRIARALREVQVSSWNARARRVLHRVSEHRAAALLVIAGCYVVLPGLASALLVAFVVLVLIDE